MESAGEGPASVTLTRIGGSKERTYSVEQVEQVAYELASVTKRLFLLVLIIDDVLEYDWFPSSTGAGDTWQRDRRPPRSVALSYQR